MAKTNDSTIIYQDQMEICMQRLDDIQLGRLMRALFQIENGENPDVEDDPVLAMALAFMALQKRVDRKKYEERCETNRRNGLKGGAPKGNKNASKQPKQPNAKKNNPNDNDNDNDNNNDNNNDDDNKAHDDELTLGTFKNVNLTDEEYAAITSSYERPKDLINKVSVWLRGATNDVPDHYRLCIKFANNDDWPRRKVIEPVEPIVVEDPLDEDEQRAKVVEMKARLNGAFTAG